jgi:hypothetical protein
VHVVVFLNPTRPWNRLRLHPLAHLLRIAESERGCDVARPHSDVKLHQNNI